MILSEDEDDRAEALTGLVDFQTGDYSAIFSTMQGRPVTVRLFDPPLHEFLPRSDEDIEETAASLGLEIRALRLRLERIAEINPMLGHRGCRLAITYPEILEMQMQALLAGVRAAIDAGCRAGDARGHGAVRLDRARSRPGCASGSWQLVDAAELPAEAAPPLRLRHHDRTAACRASAPAISRSRSISSRSAPTT